MPLIDSMRSMRLHLVVMILSLGVDDVEVTKNATEHSAEPPALSARSVVACAAEEALKRLSESGRFGGSNDFVDSEPVLVFILAGLNILDRH